MQRHGKCFGEMKRAIQDGVKTGSIHLRGGIRNGDLP